MVRKLEQFRESERLRKQGFTYDEIARVVGVSKSTVSSWLSKESWSETVRTQNTRRAARENGKRIGLLNKARAHQHKKLYAEAERSGSIEFKHYKHNPLFIAGLTLYLAHGDLFNMRSIRIAGVRPDVHRIFIRFVREFLGVPDTKIRFWLLLYPTHTPLEASRYWSRTLKLPLSRFHKYQVATKSSPERSLHYGVGNTIIGSAVLRHKLQKWIEMMLKEL